MDGTNKWHAACSVTAAMRFAGAAIAANARGSWTRPALQQQCAIHTHAVCGEWMHALQCALRGSMHCSVQ